MKPDWTKEQFIQAVQNDEYAEYDITPTLCLITDWEGDEGFYPYIVCTDMSEEYTTREVDDLLVEVDWLQCEGVEQDRDNLWYLINPEING